MKYFLILIDTFYIEETVKAALTLERKKDRETLGP